MTENMQVRCVQSRRRSLCGIALNLIRAICNRKCPKKVILHLSRALKRSYSVVSFIRTVPSVSELHRIGKMQNHTASAFCSWTLAVLFCTVFTTGGEFHPALKQSC
jgi:hypothetical protein